MIVLLGDHLDYNTGVKAARPPVLPVLQILRYPLRGVVLGAIVCLALLFRLSFAAGPFGLWLGVFCFAATIQYGFSIVRHSINGDPKPPELSAHDFQLVNTAQPLVVTLLIMLNLYIASKLLELFGVTAASFVVLLLPILFPAILAGIAVNGKLLDAFSPVQILKIIRGFGLTYLLPLVQFVTISALVYIGTLFSLPHTLLLALELYGLFLICHTTGYLVYHHRDHFGLASIYSPESREELREREDSEQHAKQLDLAYQTSRTDPDQAVVLLNNYHAQNKLNIDTLQWIFDRLKTWPSNYTALRFAQLLIPARLTNQQHAEALRCTLWCLQQDPNFRPQGPNDTLALAHAALQSGQFKLAVALLHDFDLRFPGHEQSVHALLLTTRTLAERNLDPKRVAQLLVRLRQAGVADEDPRIAQIKVLTTDG